MLSSTENGVISSPRIFWRTLGLVKRGTRIQGQEKISCRLQASGEMGSKTTSTRTPIYQLVRRDNSSFALPVNKLPSAFHDTTVTVRFLKISTNASFLYLFFYYIVSRYQFSLPLIPLVLLSCLVLCLRRGLVCTAQACCVVEDDFKVLCSYLHFPSAGLEEGLTLPDCPFQCITEILKQIQI